MGCLFKGQKSNTIINALQKILGKANHKSNKTLADKGSEVYIRSMKSWVEDNDTEMYSTHNERKYALAERFIRTLKNKIYKYMTSISKKMYIDKLAYIVNEYNNTYHSKIKMNPADVKSITYIDFTKENNKENPKFEVGDHVRISKYKNIFAKGYTSNWSEEVFVKNTVLLTYVIKDINDEKR